MKLFPCVLWACPYRLRRHHLLDALLVLLGQYGQLASLLLFQALQDGLVVTFGRYLQLMVPQSLVLLVLHLAGVLELFLDLHFQRLPRDKREVNKLKAPNESFGDPSAVTPVPFLS